MTARTHQQTDFGEHGEDVFPDAGRMIAKLGFGECCAGSKGCRVFGEDREDREDVPNPHMGAREYGVWGAPLICGQRHPLLMCAFHLSSLSSLSSLKGRQSHEI